MNNLNSQTKIRHKDTGLSAAPTALSASVAALLGLSVHCVPCSAASIADRYPALGLRILRQDTASPTQGDRPGNQRSVTARQPGTGLHRAANLDPLDRQKQARGALLSPLLDLADQLASNGASEIGTASERSDESNTDSETGADDALPAPEISVSPDAAPSKVAAENTRAFSPLVRLADQMAVTAIEAIASAQPVEQREAVAAVDESSILQNVGIAEVVIASKSSASTPSESSKHAEQRFSPLVRLAEQMASTTASVATSRTTARNYETEVFGEDQRAKNVCANLPGIPEPTPAEAAPEGLGPRLPATAENPATPTESKLFEPNLPDEPPVDLETRIRNAAPPEQFAPPEPLSAPRPLPIIPEVALKVPVVDANRSFLEATVPGDVTMDARPYLREEEFAINSEPGPFSQIHLGEKLTLDWSGIGFGLIFDDNFTVSNGNPKADTLLTISSGLTLTLGSTESRLMMRANYSASGVFFLNHSSENAFDQSLSFDVAYRMQRLTLGLHIRPSLISGSSVDAGDRVGRKIFYAGLTANYNVSDKTSINVNTDFTYAGYNGLLSSRETRVQAFVNYLVTPKVTLGLGGGYGVIDVDGGQTQTSEQALVQMSYAATAKLSLSATAGWEFRNGGDGVPTSNTPVFSVGAAWTPREKTTISVDARRRTYGSSALVGQNYEATGFSATISQQLRPRISANLTVGYEFTEYQQALFGVDASRKDNYFYTRVGLGFPVNRWCSGNVFYEFSNNSSTGNGARGFDRNRVGMFVSCKF